MKANASQRLNLGDFAGMERAFERIGQLGPEDYADWQAYARSGRDAAKARDLEECRRACKRCHDAYRATYRRTRRADPLREAR